MFSSGALGILFALTSALVWGSGDFSGGLATRRHNPSQVLALSTLSGVVMLLVFAALRGESLPSARSMLWATSAGVSGIVGIGALYRGLSSNGAAEVAPVSGVVAAAVPVVYGLFADAPPTGLQLSGFVLAILGIWLVSRPAPGVKGASRSGILLGLAAGLGFGGFFIFIGQVERGAVFAPLVVARIVSFAAALSLVLIQRVRLLETNGNPLALLAGLLDAGGNVFYLLAKQYTRLDVAAVLSSLYPATTVLLAHLVLKERVAPAQWIGVGLCLVAVALITL